MTYGEDGYAFGELALLAASKRAATIMALKDTHFAMIEKKDF